MGGCPAPNHPPEGNRRSISPIFVDMPAADKITPAGWWRRRFARNGFPHRWARESFPACSSRGGGFISADLPASTRDSAFDDEGGGGSGGCLSFGFASEGLSPREAVPGEKMIRSAKAASGR